MITALKIIGLLAIIAVLVIGVAVFWFFRWIRKAMKAEADMPPTPCRINPEPEPNPQWRNPAQIQKYAAEFQAAGFESAGAFCIPELRGLQILGFAHPAERLFGVIYDHEKIPPNFDVGCDFEDGTGVCAGNTDMGKTLDKRPDYTILWLGKVSLAEAIKAVAAHPTQSVRKPVSCDQFLVEFKKGYARSMNWRMKKGGASRDEIKRQAEADGLEMTAEQIEESYQSLRESYLRELQAGCVAQFLDERSPTAAEWERMRDRTLVIPETMDVKEISAAMQDVLQLDDEQRHQLGKVTTTFGETGVDVTRRILNENIGALGLEAVGEVQEPVHAILLKASRVR
jgi:hypothetical protein